MLIFLVTKHLLTLLKLEKTCGCACACACVNECRLHAVPVAASSGFDRPKFIFELLIFYFVVDQK